MLPTCLLYLCLYAFSNLCSTSKFGRSRLLILFFSGLWILADAFLGEPDFLHKKSKKEVGENELASSEAFVHGHRENYLAMGSLTLAIAAFLARRRVLLIATTTKRERLQHVVNVVAQVAVSQLPLSVFFASEYFACLSRYNYDGKEETQQCDDLKTGLVPIICMTASIGVAQVSFFVSSTLTHNPNLANLLRSFSPFASLTLSFALASLAHRTSPRHSR
jgi:hypothetical protein